MVVGYDTYPDSLDKRRSVGGFVCSLNQTLTSWYSRVTYHQNQEEMSSNFATNFRGQYSFSEFDQRISDFYLISQSVRQGTVTPTMFCFYIFNFFSEKLIIFLTSLIISTKHNYVILFVIEVLLNKTPFKTLILI